MNAKVALYSAVGEEFTRYEVDVDSATLIKHESIKTPGVVQCAWPHPSKIQPHAVREGNTVTPVPAALSVFRIGNDGKLAFVR